MDEDSQPTDQAGSRPTHDFFPDWKPIVLRLMPDYGPEGPLWPSSDDTDALIPEPLLTRLKAWQDELFLNWNDETGWRSPEAKNRWADEARTLEAELRIALDGIAELTVDLWPLGSDRPDR